MNEKDLLVYVYVNDHVIKTTEEHPFWVEGIEYSNAIPDFSAVSKGQVEIKGMSVDRRLNFKKADEALAKELGKEPKEIAKMRKAEKLTWHELNDTKTMQLVPTIINSKFGHLGGVSEISKIQ